MHKAWFSQFLITSNLVLCLLVSVAFAQFCFVGEKCLQRDRKKLPNSCVTLGNFSDDWFNARMHCLARGGDLAVLSDQDLPHVVQAIKDTPINMNDQQRALFPFWIGLRNMSWVWQLDSKGSFKINLLVENFNSIADAL